MLKWFRKPTGDSTSSDRRDRIPYPQDDENFMRDDHGDYAPKIREALHELQATRPPKPIIQPALPLSELVAEWERLGVHFINQVQYVQDIHKDLGRLRSQIDERLAARNEQLEDEHARNEELRKRIGGSDVSKAEVPASEARRVEESDPPAPSSGVSVSDLLASTSLTEPPSGGNGKRRVHDITPSAFRESKRPPALSN